jgi:two-component system, cell cycle sensor histidine kinase and response regulator CckA
MRSALRTGRTRGARGRTVDGEGLDRDTLRKAETHGAGRGTPRAPVVMVDGQGGHSVGGDPMDTPEARFRDLTDRLPVGVFRMAADGSLLYANPALLEIVGAASLEEARSIDLSSTLDRAVGAAGLRASLDAEAWLSPRDVSIPRRTGGETWVRVSARVTFREGGEIGELEGYIEDRSEEQRATEALRQIMDFIPVGVFVTDEAGRPRFMNRHGKDLLGSGMAPGATEEESSQIYKAFIADTDEPYPLRELPSVKALTGVTTAVEDIEIAHDRGRIRLAVWGTPIRDDDGSIAGAATAFLDITERFHTERSVDKLGKDLNLILSSVGEGIYRVDAEGKITFVNPVAAAALGWEPEELIGRVAHDVFHDGDEHDAARPIERCSLTTAVRHGTITRVDDDVFHRKDGSQLSVGYITAPIREGGKITGAVSSFRDNTDRMAREREREDLAARLRRTERLESLGQLAGGVAHDFNNMLSAIIGYASFLEEDLADDERLLGEVREITRAAERAAELTHQLLDFSRRDAAPEEVVDLNDVVRLAERFLSRTLGENISLRLDLSSEPALVLGSEGPFEQILVNLCVNARDAMPSGGTIRVATRLVDVDAQFAEAHPGLEAGRHVRLTVTDQGSGMTDEETERAFEPFFTSKPAGKGTGLGLATVYGIVTRFGGHVSIQTDIGVGTTISIMLPLVLADGALASDEMPAVAPRGRGQAILVVEDEEAVRAIANRILTRAGYEVLSAASPAQALEIARLQAQIAVLLADVALPGMPGTELAEAIRALHPAAAVVYMSGYPTDIVTHPNGLNAPLLDKPFSAESLAQAIDDAISAKAP